MLLSKSRQKFGEISLAFRGPTTSTRRIPLRMGQPNAQAACFVSAAWVTSTRLQAVGPSFVPPVKPGMEQSRFGRFRWPNHHHSFPVKPMSDRYG